MMEPRLLRSFVAVAEELHFGRAARRLHLSQPPLSMQIRRLEAELGVSLFTRSRHAVSLTEPGQALLGRARSLLLEADRAVQEVQRVARGESGVLAIGYTPNATFQVLPRLVPKFRARWPEVRLDLIELRSLEQPDALRAGRIEVGFACLPIDPGDLVQRAVTRERMVVALPATHALAKRARIPVTALRDLPYIRVPPEIEPGWSRLAFEALTRAGVSLVIAQEADTKLAMLGLVAAGMGVSVVSESMSSLGPRGVAFRPLSGVSERFELGVLSTRSPSARALALLELARS